MNMNSKSPEQISQHYQKKWHQKTSENIKEDEVNFNSIYYRYQNNLSRIHVVHETPRFCQLTIHSWKENT